MARSIVPAAIVAVAFAAALAGWEAFRPHAHPVGAEAAGHEDSIAEYFLVLAIIGVAALVVFGVVVRRGLKRESAAWTGLVLSVLGLLAIAAFWSGLPPVLAAGGILLGWVSRDASRYGRVVAWAAIVIGAVAIVGDVVVYVGDIAS